MAINERDNICIYIDLENITGNLNLKKIMQDIRLKYETKEQNMEPLFVYKIACGNMESIPKYREQLKGLNFEIREAPHIVNKKNRSDLIISLDAFEKLYLDRPTINEFVFLTNDSDFSVIMDILRRYGRKVVLITTKEDSNREIFNNCSDQILLMDDYIETKEPIVSPENIVPSENIDDIDTNDSIAINNLMSVLRALDPDKEYLSAQVGSKFKDIDKSFDISKTSFKKFNMLAEYFQKKGIIKIDPNKNQFDKVITLADIPMEENIGEYWFYMKRIMETRKMDAVTFGKLQGDVYKDVVNGELTNDEICKKYSLKPEEVFALAKVVDNSLFSEVDNDIGRSENIYLHDDFE